MIDKIKSWFRSKTHQFLDYLEEKHYRPMHYVFSQILLEPISTIKKLLCLPLGWKPHFNFYGLNPKALNLEQSECNPVILLHGNNSNQSSWLSLASALSQKYKGPVFTVNLPAGDYSQRDIDIIESKITEIKYLYKDKHNNNMVVNLVGFCRGSNLALFMSFAPKDWEITTGQLGYSFPGERQLTYRRDIGRVIMITFGSMPYGYNSVDEVTDKFRYIHGTEDLQSKKPITLRSKHRVNVVTGHAGINIHPEAHHAICRWLNEPFEKPKEDLVVQFDEPLPVTCPVM